MLVAAKRFPALLRGEDKPKDNTERLAFAQMCCDTKRFATAARVWDEALQADPKLGDDRQNWLRYNAACTAALAAAGAGKDEPQPDDVAKAKLRGQALGWLKAELAAWTKLFEIRAVPGTRRHCAAHESLETRHRPGGNSRDRRPGKAARGGAEGLAGTLGRCGIFTEVRRGTTVAVGSWGLSREGRGSPKWIRPSQWARAMP